MDEKKSIQWSGINTALVFDPRHTIAQNLNRNKRLINENPTRNEHQKTRGRLRNDPLRDPNPFYSTATRRQARNNISKGINSPIKNKFYKNVRGSENFKKLFHEKRQEIYKNIKKNHLHEYIADIVEINPELSQEEILKKATELARADAIKFAKDEMMRMKLYTPEVAEEAGRIYAAEAENIAYEQSNAAYLNLPPGMNANHIPNLPEYITESQFPEFPQEYLAERPSSPNPNSPYNAKGGRRRNMRNSTDDGMLFDVMVEELPFIGGSLLKSSHQRKSKRKSMKRKSNKKIKKSRSKGRLHN